jgi:hypothetical protein
MALLLVAAVATLTLAGTIYAAGYWRGSVTRYDACIASSIAGEAFLICPAPK